MMPEKLNSVALRQHAAIQSTPWLRIRATMQANIQLRLAVPEDVPVLREVIDASVRGLQAQDYTPAQIEGALKTVFGVDSQLIADGTYLVAEAVPSGSESHEPEYDGAASLIAGCGGWSKRKTLYGGDRWTGREDELLDPLPDAAKIRAVFIPPARAPQGNRGMVLGNLGLAARAAGV